MDDDSIESLDSAQDTSRKRIPTNRYSRFHDRNERGTRKAGNDVVKPTTKRNMAGKRKVSGGRGRGVRGRLSDYNILGDVSSYVESSESDEEETLKKKKQQKVQGKSPAMGKRKSSPKGSTTKGKSPTENRERGTSKIAKNVATSQGRNESSSGSESKSEDHDREGVKLMI
jgi:hypothetical protein